MPLTFSENYIIMSCILVGVFGLIIGSFLNVVIYRLPRGESIISPSSHCPKCNHFLRPWELIPVVSFIIQGTRCRNCRSKISWRYPLIELLTGCLFFYTAWQYSGILTISLFVRLLFISVLVALAFIDIDTFRLPDILVLPLLSIGIITAFFQLGHIGIGESLLGSIVAGGMFGLIAWVYPKGMGWGDVKFVAALGSFLGFPGIAMTIFIASLAGVIIGVAIALFKGKGFRAEIPFGPYLVLGALISMYWGENIVIWYISSLI